MSSYSSGRLVSKKTAMPPRCGRETLKSGIKRIDVSNFHREEIISEADV